MRTLLAALRARHDADDWQPDSDGWGRVMSGPVDPAHDPCGRPPLPAEEANHA